MKNLTLYRGISVSEIELDSTIDSIQAKGLVQNSKQTWNGFIWKNLKADIDVLYQKEDLTRVDTSPRSKWVKTKNGGHRVYSEGEKSICFADRYGAEYYATKHNITKEHIVPLLITVNIDIGSIAIDGRDFLYTVFGCIEPNDLAKTKRQTDKLKKLFGKKIEKYITKIIRHPNSEKLAICDLAIIDNEIIIDHSKNELIIGGRCNTTFRSAFFVKVPIHPNQIISVERIKNVSSLSYPQITLNEILEI